MAWGQVSASQHGPCFLICEMEMTQGPHTQPPARRGQLRGCAGATPVVKQREEGDLLPLVPTGMGHGGGSQSCCS